MRLRYFAGTVVAAMLIVPSLAEAHARLLDPPPRDPNQIKVFPCGGLGPIAAGSSQRTVLQAGSTITVEFEEFVQHPGYFRIAFSPDGLTGFDDHVLVPMIADTNDLHYTVQVPLPSTPCDNCSIQLIQCMDSSLPPIASCSNYYSCADVILQGTGAPYPDAGPGAPDAGPPVPGQPDAGAPSSDPGGSDPGNVSGACMIAPGHGASHTSAAWALPLFVAYVGRRLARRSKS